MEQIVRGDLKKLRTAGFLTEWGALVDASPLSADEANSLTVTTCTDRVC